MMGTWTSTERGWLFFSGKPVSSPKPRARGNKEKRDSLLTLLEELGETRSTSEEETGRGIEIGTELGERGNITVLGEVELERTSDRLHDLGLGGRSDTRDGKTDVDGRSDTLEEELSLQEDLSITVKGPSQSTKRRTGRRRKTRLT